MAEGMDGNCRRIETVTSLASEYQVKVPILIGLIHGKYSEVL
jgi:hypothetical protein